MLSGRPNSAFLRVRWQRFLSLLHLVSFALLKPVPVAAVTTRGKKKTTTTSKTTGPKPTPVGSGTPAHVAANASKEDELFLTTSAEKSYLFEYGKKLFAAVKQMEQQTIPLLLVYSDLHGQYQDADLKNGKIFDSPGGVPNTLNDCFLELAIPAFQPEVIRLEQQIKKETPLHQRRRSLIQDNPEEVAFFTKDAAVVLLQQVAEKLLELQKKEEELLQLGSTTTRPGPAGSKSSSTVVAVSEEEELARAILLQFGDELEVSHQRAEREQNLQGKMNADFRTTDTGAEHRILPKDKKPQFALSQRDWFIDGRLQFAVGAGGEEKHAAGGCTHSDPAGSCSATTSHQAARRWSKAPTRMLELMRFQQFSDGTHASDAIPNAFSSAVLFHKPLLHGKSYLETLRVVAYRLPARILPDLVYSQRRKEQADKRGDRIEEERREGQRIFETYRAGRFLEFSAEVPGEEGGGARTTSRKNQKGKKGCSSAASRGTRNGQSSAGGNAMKGTGSNGSSPANFLSPDKDTAPEQQVKELTANAPQSSDQTASARMNAVCKVNKPGLESLLTAPLPSWECDYIYVVATVEETETWTNFKLSEQLENLSTKTKCACSRRNRGGGGSATAVEVRETTGRGGGNVIISSGEQDAARRAASIPPGSNIIEGVEAAIATDDRLAVSSGSTAAAAPAEEEEPTRLPAASSPASTDVVGSKSEVSLGGSSSSKGDTARMPGPAQSCSSECSPVGAVKLKGETTSGSRRSRSTSSSRSLPTPAAASHGPDLKHQLEAEARQAVLCGSSRSRYPSRRRGKTKTSSRSASPVRLSPRRREKKSQDLQAGGVSATATSTSNKELGRERRRSRNTSTSKARKVPRPAATEGNQLDKSEASSDHDEVVKQPKDQPDEQQAATTTFRVLQPATTGAVGSSGAGISIFNSNKDPEITPERGDIECCSSIPDDLRALLHEGQSFANWVAGEVDAVAPQQKGAEVGLSAKACSVSVGDVTEGLQKMKLSDGPDAVLSKAAPSSSDTNARNKELQEAVTARLSQFVDHAGRHRRTAEEDDSVFAEALLAREKKAMLASRSLPSTPPRRGIDTKRETDLNRSPGASSTGSKKDRFHPIATPEPEDYDYQHLPPQIAHATAPAPSGRQMDHRGVDLEMLPTYNLMQQINMMHNFPLLHQQEGFLATGGELSNTSAADCSSNYTGTGSETTASGVLAQGSPCSSSAELQQYQLSGGGNNTITFSPGMHHMIPCYFPAPVTVPAGTVVRVPVAQDGQAQGSGEGGVPVSNVMPHEQEIFHPDETQITPKNTPRNGD